MVETTSERRLLQIGEIAERAGLSLRTIRYYEEMELVVPEARTEGGFRLYTEEHLHRLALIRRMKPLNFTLQEMRQLIEAREVLRVQPNDPIARQRLADFANQGAERTEDLAAKARRGFELVELLRHESRGQALPELPPSFFEATSSK